MTGAAAAGPTAERTPMQAAVLTEVGAPLQVQQLTLLPPGDRGVIIRTEASAFCITDCRAARGELGRPQPPTIFGHSAVGVVEEVGPGVSRVRVGDRVVMPASPECGVCYWCARDRPDQCVELTAPPRQVATAADGTVVTAAGGGVGAYASYLNLREISVYPVQSELPADVLSLVGCGVTSGLGAVFNAAAVTPGSSVGIVGAGHLGLWMAQGARVAGAEQIIVLEPARDRRELALRFGATAVVDPADGDPVEQVRELTDGRGVDYGLEAAGPPEAMRVAFEMTRSAGTVVFTGAVRSDAEASFSAFMLALRGRTLRSCQNGMCKMFRDIPRAVRLLEAGAVKVGPIISGRYRLQQINEVSAATDERRGLTGVIEF